MQVDEYLEHDFLLPVLQVVAQMLWKKAVLPSVLCGLRE